VSTVAAHLEGPSPQIAQRVAVRSVPRAFQGILVAYVLLTGDLVRGAQAALFGLQGGGEGAFTAAVLLAIAIDVVRIAPLFVYARHPLGVLHPLILATVLWPLLSAMPGRIEELWGFGGLLLGEPISPPFFEALGWLPGPQIWGAVAWSNLCELVALLSIYGGYALVHDRGALPPTARQPREFDAKRIRALAIAVIGISVGVLLVLVWMRGGLAEHLGNMARGRFRSMAGLGPLVAAVDLGLIALMVWVAARPNDVRQPIFIALMIGQAAAQFISNGARSAAFAVFMMVGLTWALRTRRIPWRLAVILIPMFFIAFGALNIIRTAGFSGQSGGEAIQESSPGQILSRVQEEMDLRQALQSTVPVISHGHEVMGGPLWGGSYAAAVFAFVPRAIWPAKPRGPGSLYAQNFLGEVREGLAVPVNPTAEEYWNFGLLGVIVISALYGALIRVAHNFYIVRQDNPFALTAFALFVTTFHPSTDDLVSMQIQGALLLIILGLAMVFAVKFRPSGIGPPPGYPPASLSRPLR
jgi:hypothetical protein